MNLQNETDRINPRAAECMRLNKCWGWFLVLGIVLIVVGVLAIGSAFITTFTSIMVFGFLLLAGGVVQIVNAFLARGWQGFFLHLLIGILHLIIGGLMIEHPLRAAAGLTLMLAAAFMIGGIFRVIYGLMEPFTGRMWVMVNGLVTFVLGVAIWRQWPESSLWVIGLFIGIDLVFAGFSWVMLALLVKTEPSYQAPTDAAGHSPAV